MTRIFLRYPTECVNSAGRMVIRWRRFDVAPGPLFVVEQPVLVVPDEMAISDDMNLYQKSFAQGHNACRAAMLAPRGEGAPLLVSDAKNTDSRPRENEPVSQPYKLPPNSFTNEDLEMMAHGDNPQSNAYRELLAFRRNSPVIPDEILAAMDAAPEQRFAAVCKRFYGK